MVAQYLIPGEIPEAVSDHLERHHGYDVATQTISRPRAITGYLVSRREIECGILATLTGIDYDSYRSAVGTNIDNTLLVERYTSNYGDGSPRVVELLKRLAVEFEVSIRGQYAYGAYCFSGESRCGYCNEDQTTGEEPYRMIHFNCSRRGIRSNAAPLERLYEFPLGNRGPANLVRMHRLEPQGTGEIVRDTNGTPVAEVEDGAIYLLVDIDAPTDTGRSFENRYWSHNAEVLERILKEALPLAIAQVTNLSDGQRLQRLVERQRRRLARTAEDSTASFLAMPVVSSSERIRVLRQSIQDLSSQASDYLHQYVRTQRTLNGYAEELNALEAAPQVDPTEKRRQELASVRAMQGILEVKFERCLHVYTDIIDIEYGGVKYRIGAFDISIDFARGVITFRNFTDPSGSERNPHPHVSSGGDACFGNITDVVPELLVKEELEMLVIVLLQFLRSYNPDSPMQRIDAWPILAE